MVAPVPRAFTGPGSNTFLAEFAGTSTPIGRALANGRVFNPKPNGHCLLAVFAWFLVLLGLCEPCELPSAEEMRRIVAELTHGKEAHLFAGLGPLSAETVCRAAEYLGFGEVAGLAYFFQVNVWIYEVHGDAPSAPVCLADYFMATETSVSPELMGHLWKMNRNKPPVLLLFDAHACHFGAAYGGIYPFCMFVCSRGASY